MPLQLLIPAFMISELRRAFEIGFLLFLPFVIIDMVVASVLMSHGHDDAAASGDLAAVQADFLRSGGRLVSGGRIAGAQLRQHGRRIDQDRPLISLAGRRPACHKPGRYP
jgi:hypothetical protein